MRLLPLGVGRKAHLLRFLLRHFVSLNLSTNMIAVKPQQATPFYEFGPYCVDTAKCVLLRQGQTLPLSLKAFEVLLVLIKHRGQVLEKDEILKEVWPDTVVEENNLARHISALRKTLDEPPNGHQIGRAHV